MTFLHKIIYSTNIYWKLLCAKANLRAKIRPWGWAQHKQPTMSNYSMNDFFLYYGPRVCHAEWSKSEIEKQITYANAYIWNLKTNGTDEPSGRAGIKV